MRSQCGTRTAAKLTVSGAVSERGETRLPESRGPCGELVERESRPGRGSLDLSLRVGVEEYKAPVVMQEDLEERDNLEVLGVRQQTVHMRGLIGL